MKLKFCAVCGTVHDLHQHHINPRVYGEEYDKSSIWDDGCITLCSTHHRMIHDNTKNLKYNHKELTVEGLKRAKINGKKLGRKPKTTDEEKEQILDHLIKGFSVSAVSRKYKISRATVINIRDNSCQTKTQK